MGERIAWWLLIRVCRWWSTRYMDQWTKMRLRTDYGPVFISIMRMDPYPHTFDDYDEYEASEARHD